MKLLFCSLFYSVCSSLQTLLITSVLKKNWCINFFSLLPLLSFPLSLLPPFLCVWLHVCGCVHQSKRTLAFLLNYSLAYSLEIGSLLESAAMVENSKPQEYNTPASMKHSSGVKLKAFHIFCGDLNSDSHICIVASALTHWTKPHLTRTESMPLVNSPSSHTYCRVGSSLQ